MKKILIIVLLLVLGIQVNAQIAHYYKNVQKKHATSITKSDEVSIETYGDGLSCVYWFSDTGICNRIAMQWDSQTYESLLGLLKANDQVVWSAEYQYWYNYNAGQDGKSYLVISKVKYDTNGDPYINIQIKYD